MRHKSVLEPHARKFCVCNMRDDTVWCAPPVAYKGIAIEFYQRTLNTKSKKEMYNHHFCHPEDDRHDVEDDDEEVEDGHHIQTVFGPTDHAIVCSERFAARSYFSVVSWSVAESLCCWNC